MVERLEQTNNTYSYTAGAGHGFIYRDARKAIPGLKPELVENLEFGLDLKLFENRLGAQFTVSQEQFHEPIVTGWPPGWNRLRKPVHQCW
jgi:hypothetical protein